MWDLVVTAIGVGLALIVDTLLLIGLIRLGQWIADWRARRRLRTPQLLAELDRLEAAREQDELTRIHGSLS